MYTLEEDIIYSKSLNREVKRLGAPEEAAKKLWSKWFEGHGEGERRALGDAIECKPIPEK